MATVGSPNIIPYSATGLLLVSEMFGKEVKACQSVQLEDFKHLECVGERVKLSKLKLKRNNDYAIPFHLL